MLLVRSLLSYTNSTLLKPIPNQLNITQQLGCCTSSTSNFVGIIPRLMLGHFCKMNGTQLEYCSFCKVK